MEKEEIQEALERAHKRLVAYIQAAPTMVMPVLPLPVDEAIALRVAAEMAMEE